jgi:hypothetical protein
MTQHDAAVENEDINQRACMHLLYLVLHYLRWFYFTYTDYWSSTPERGQKGKKPRHGVAERIK